MRGASAAAASLKCLAFALVVLCPVPLARAASSDATEAQESALIEAPSVPLKAYDSFPMGPKLEPRVRFWVDIYARYHSWEALLVDIRHPELVYSVIDTRGKPGVVASAKRRIRASLRRIADRWPGIQAGESRSAVLQAADLRVLEAIERAGLTGEIGGLVGDPRRLRAQNGLRDALGEALFASGRYLPRMEALFSRFGLPPEIAYLPFVESGFNKKAVSKMGASGIWQFMPYTGKLFLRVDDVVDERNDPMRAAEAAARLMRRNFEVLGEWPLAITAYNHGTAGVARAARETGTREIVEIIARYESASFGFASQNFYACFLAAMHVAKNAEAYLGDVPRARKLEFDEFVMPDFMALGDFLGKMGIDETIFRELNPALTQEVYEGRKLVPVGYTVRVPMEASAGFLQRYEAIPAELKARKQREEEPAAVGSQASAE